MLLASAATLTSTSPLGSAQRGNLSRENEQFLVPENPATIPPPPPQRPITQGYVTVPGGQIWYWDSGGQGPIVLLLHALSGSALSWPYQQPALIKAGYRLIGFSQRGASGSSPAMKGIGMTALADTQALVSSLGLNRINVVGTAAGAFTALRFAIAEPKLVRSLTLSCSLGGLSEPSLQAMIRSIHFPGFDALPIEVKELSASYRASNADGVKRWLEIEKASAAHIPAEVASPGSNPPLNPMLESGPRYSDLQSIRVPVQLIFGDADLYAPPAIGRAIAREIPGCKLSIIGECGHSAYWEQPHAFNATLINFLESKADS